MHLDLFGVDFPNFYYPQATNLRKQEPSSRQKRSCSEKDNELSPHVKYIRKYFARWQPPRHSNHSLSLLCCPWPQVLCTSLWYEWWWLTKANVHNKLVNMTKLWVISRFFVWKFRFCFLNLFPIFFRIKSISYSIKHLYSNPYTIPHHTFFFFRTPLLIHRDYSGSLSPFIQEKKKTDMG